MPPILAFTPFRVAVAAFVAGILLRWPGLPYATADASDFLLPWYEFACRHGFAGLGQTFANYTPTYTYFVVLASKLDGIAAPLTLIKWISFVFEAASALVAARLVGFVDPRPMRAALAFSLVWLAPSVIHNGAFWGQAESVWTFFILLTLLALCRGRGALAVAAFAVAFSIKAQAIFLAPLGLALLLNGTIRWRWLVVVPAIYLLLALPTILLGRSIADVASVYFSQAGLYSALSMNAANPYIFLPPRFYGIGLPVGMALSAVAGLLFAAWVARGGKLTPERLILAAAVSLFLMPFLLPKMHERYFYAFEIVILILAVGRPNLAGLAVIAQITSTLTYLAFDGFGGLGIPVAALSYVAVLAFLLHRLHLALAGRDPFGDASRLHVAVLMIWLAYLLQIALLPVAARFVDPESVWPFAFWDWRGMAGYALLLGLLIAGRWLAMRPARPMIVA